MNQLNPIQNDIEFSNPVLMEAKYQEIEKNLNHKKEDKTEMASLIVVPNIILLTD